MTTVRGTRLHRDYSKTEWREPGEGYTGEEPVKGLYPFRLVNVEEHTSGEGNESLHWTFEATEDAVGKNGDEYAGWRGHIYTNDDAALWKEQQIMVALGLIKPNGQYKGTLAAIVKRGARVVVMGRVIRERYIPEDGGEGEWRAKLTTVMTPRGDGSTTDKGRDDEDDIDEDEVDEKPPPKTRRGRKPAPEPESEDEPDEEYDLDELAEELEAMSLVALKKHAKEEFGMTAAELRGLDKEDIIENILENLENEEDEEDEEPEEEPEPPKRTRTTRASASSKTASTARTRSGRGRSKSDDEDLDPPF